MIRFLRWSMWAYRVLLMLYPDDLRRGFGPEMLEAFAQDLFFACDAHGVKGAIRIWRITLRELIRIGLPALLRTPSIAVPALSAAVFLVSESPLLVIAIRWEARLGFHRGDTILSDTLCALGIGTAIVALTSFVAVYRWKRTAFISLDIEPLGLA